MNIKRCSVVGLLAIAIAIVSLVGCEDPTAQTQTHVLNPPTWIHGTWSYCEPDNVNLEYWKFSAHNIVHRFDATVTDYRETAKSPDVTIREDSGDGWYRFEMEAQGSTVANRFARDGSRLQWTRTFSGTSTTESLCR